MVEDKHEHGLDDDEECEKKDRRIVTLNVGGELFTTTEATLMSQGENYISNLVRANQPISVPKDEHGHPFVDRDKELFAYILHFLRGNFMVFEFMSERKMKHVIEEAKFYGIDALVDRFYPEISERTKMREANLMMTVQLASSFLPLDDALGPWGKFISSILKDKKLIHELLDTMHTSVAVRRALSNRDELDPEGKQFDPDRAQTLSEALSRCSMLLLSSKSGQQRLTQLVTDLAQYIMQRTRHTGAPAAVTALLAANLNIDNRPWYQRWPLRALKQTKRACGCVSSWWSQLGLLWAAV